MVLVERDGSVIQSIEGAGSVIQSIEGVAKGGWPVIAVVSIIAYATLWDSARGKGGCCG